MPYSARRPITLLGPTADRPGANAVGLVLGDSYAATDAATLDVLVDSGAGRQWVSLSGGGGAAGWSKYVVAPAGAGQPAVLYNTIQAAIDAAVTDGHTTLDPAVILIHPGVYSEDLILPEAVHLAGLSVARDGGVLIDGSVTKTAAGTSWIANLAINSDGAAVGAALVWSGALSGRLALRNVSFQTAAGANAIVVTNSHAASTLILENVQASGGGAGFPTVRVTSVTTVTVRDSQFSTTITQVVLELGPGVAVLNDCEFFGQVSAPSGAGTSARLSRCLFTVQNTPALNVAAAGAVTVETSRFEMSGTATLGTGAGTLTLQDVTHNGPPTLANTLLTVAAATDRTHTIEAFTGAGPHAPGTDIADLTTVAPPGAGNADLTLPDTRTLPNGRRITVRKTAVDGTLTITPAAGDTIDGAATLVLAASAGAPHAVQLQSDRVTRNWIPVASF